MGSAFIFVCNPGMVEGLPRLRGSHARENDLAAAVRNVLTAMVLCRNRNRSAVTVLRCQALTTALKAYSRGVFTPSFSCTIGDAVKVDQGCDATVELLNSALASFVDGACGRVET